MSDYVTTATFSKVVGKLVARLEALEGKPAEPVADGKVLVSREDVRALLHYVKGVCPICNVILCDCNSVTALDAANRIFEQILADQSDTQSHIKTEG